MRTVGDLWAEPGWTGNQWARIFVPSNEVTSQSLGRPGTGAATTGRLGTGRWHVVVSVMSAGRPVPDAGADDDDEHPVRTTAATAKAARTELERRPITPAPFLPHFTPGVSHPAGLEAIIQLPTATWRSGRPPP
jgi:hypothetical protein